MYEGEDLYKREEFLGPGVEEYMVEEKVTYWDIGVYFAYEVAGSRVLSEPKDRNSNETVG